MPRTFDCPKCGAPVNYTENATGQATVRCGYCTSVLTEPNPTLGQPAHIVAVNIGASPHVFKPLRWLWLILLVPLAGVVVTIIALVVGLTPLFRTAANKNTSPPSPPSRPTDTRPKRTEEGPAKVLFTFGSEGIGPGMFKDARSIAVDGSGNIYVGEYTGGRVQVFDSTGKFITQWSVDPKMPLRGIAADRKGNLYVVQSGKIFRYEGATGDQLSELQYPGGWGFDDVTPTADGGLVCVWYKGSDDIVRFNASGQVVKTIKAAISSNSGRSELNTRVAVDGLGNIYALGTFNEAVFKFGPDGKFINRFGGGGGETGQFRAASSIAVDGRGRVYVSDIKGIQIFDADGRYLKLYKPEGHAFGMVFNDKNELFVAARNKVIKLNFTD
jgi:DNA-binding beta-propeller fold protein YncE